MLPKQERINGTALLTTLAEKGEAYYLMTDQDAERISQLTQQGKSPRITWVADYLNTSEISSQRQFENPKPKGSFYLIAKAEKDSRWGEFFVDPTAKTP